MPTLEKRCFLSCAGKLCPSPARASVPVPSVYLLGMAALVKKNRLHIGQDSSFSFSDLIVNDALNDVWLKKHLRREEIERFRVECADFQISTEQPGFAIHQKVGRIPINMAKGIVSPWTFAA